MHRRPNAGGTFTTGCEAVATSGNLESARVTGPAGEDVAAE
jgi:hypothetical protein